MNAQPIQTTQTVDIPERFKRLGVQRGFNPDDPDSLNLLIEALPGAGKTTFLMGIPDCLVLDFECAANNVIAPRAAYIPVPTWEKYEEIKKELLEYSPVKLAGRKPPFKHIGFDTIDQFLYLLDQHLCEEVNAVRAQRPDARLLTTIKEYGSEGAGYVKLAEGMLRELHEFLQAGYTLKMAAHMKVRRQVVGDEVIEEKGSLAPPSIMQPLVRMADVKARLYRHIEDKYAVEEKEIVKEDGTRTKVRVTASKPTTVVSHYLGIFPQSAADAANNDTKRRIPEMKVLISIPLIHGYDAFKKAYLEAVEKAKQLETQVVRKE